MILAAFKIADIGPEVCSILDDRDQNVNSYSPEAMNLTFVATITYTLIFPQYSNLILPKKFQRLFGPLPYKQGQEEESWTFVAFPFLIRDDTYSDERMNKHTRGLLMLVFRKTDETVLKHRKSIEAMLNEKLSKLKDASAISVDFLREIRSNLLSFRRTATLGSSQYFQVKTILHQRNLLVISTTELKKEVKAYIQKYLIPNLNLESCYLSQTSAKIITKEMIIDSFFDYSNRNFHELLNHIDGVIFVTLGTLIPQVTDDFMNDLKIVLNKTDKSISLSICYLNRNRANVEKLIKIVEQNYDRKLLVGRSFNFFGFNSVNELQKTISEAILWTISLH